MSTVQIYDPANPAKPRALPVSDFNPRRHTRFDQRLKDDVERDLEAFAKRKADEVKVEAKRKKTAADRASAQKDKEAKAEAKSRKEEASTAKERAEQFVDSEVRKKALDAVPKRAPGAPGQ